MKRKIKKENILNRVISELNIEKRDDFFDKINITLKEKNIDEINSDFLHNKNSDISLKKEDEKKPIDSIENKIEKDVLFENKKIVKNISEKKINKIKFFIKDFVFKKILENKIKIFYILTALSFFYSYFFEFKIQSILFISYAFFLFFLLKKAFDFFLKKNHEIEFYISFFICSVLLKEILDLTKDGFADFQNWIFQGMTLTNSKILILENTFLHVFLIILIVFYLVFRLKVFFENFFNTSLIFFKKNKKDIKKTVIPKKPDFLENLSICVGEIHEPETGARVQKASLMIIPEKGLFTNLFVFGSIGSGKTVFLLSILEQILSYKKYDPSLKPAGLFIDEKGNLGVQVKEIAKRINREEDIYLLDLSGNIVWNPIHEPEKGADAIARRLEKIMEVTVERSSDWIRKYSFEFLVSIINLIRITSEDYYITLKEINYHAKNSKLIKEKLKFLVENKTAISDRLKLLKTDLQNIDLTLFLDEQIKILEIYFYHSWFKLEACNQEVYGYVSTAIHQLTSPFLNPKISHIFNPIKPENINFKGFDWMINEGKLFVFSIPDSIYEGLGKFISLFFKTAFQQTCLSRISKTTPHTLSFDPSYNKERAILFVADENQNSYHPSDNNFLDKLREAKVIHICLSQTLVSLLAQKNSESGIFQYLSSFRNKLFLSSDDYKSATFYSNLIGMELKQSQSFSLSESSRDASISFLQKDINTSQTNFSKSVSYSEKMELKFDVSKFLNLKTFQGIFSGFDGFEKIPPSFVYIKPYFLDWEKDFFSSFLDKK